jgi:hypothetical protein
MPRKCAVDGRIGEAFKESNSDSIAMVLPEGDKPLGDVLQHVDTQT